MACLLPFSFLQLPQALEKHRQLLARDERAVLLVAVSVAHDQSVFLGPLARLRAPVRRLLLNKRAVFFYFLIDFLERQ